MTKCYEDDPYLRKSFTEIVVDPLTKRKKKKKEGFRTTYQIFIRDESKDVS